jgi:hypothetical protein
LEFEDSKISEAREYCCSYLIANVLWEFAPKGESVGMGPFVPIGVISGGAPSAGTRRISLTLCGGIAAPHV